MLAIGPMAMNGGKCRLTENEELLAYTMHAFFPSPVQLSCRLDKVTEFEFDLFCNEEVLAVNQDRLCDYPVLLRDYHTSKRHLKVYARRLEDGDYAVALFNFGAERAMVEIPLSAQYAVRNLWEKRSLGVMDTLRCTAEGHAASLYRIRKA